MRDDIGKSTLNIVRDMKKALKRDTILAILAGAILFWAADSIDLVNLIHKTGHKYSFYKTDLIINFLLSAFLIYTFFSFSRFIEMFGFFRVMMKISRIDYLTRIYNRRALIEELEIEFSKKERYSESGFSFILFDIDDFKEINDSYGHSVGDMVLLKVAETLTKSIRKSDLCGRFGGDEFGIILTLTDLDNGLKVAEKILKKVSAHEFSSGKSKFKITLSMGVVEVKPDSKITNIEKLINETDKYLYMAKQKGKNTVCSKYCTGNSPFKS